MDETMNPMPQEGEEEQTDGMPMPEGDDKEEGDDEMTPATPETDAQEM